MTDIATTKEICDGIDFAIEEIKKMQDEIERLREFAQFVMTDGPWQGCDVDGGSAQDKAEKLGLIELRPCKPEDSIDGETEHYFTKWTPND